MIDRNMVKRFKAVQEGELQTWKGVNCKFTSRPGMSEASVQSGLTATTQMNTPSTQS